MRVRLLECFGFQRAGAAESGGRLPRHHVGVGADGDDARVASAAGEDDGRSKKKRFKVGFQVKKIYITRGMMGYITREIGLMPNTSPHAKEPALVAFGAAIRASRVGVGLSQEDLANGSGIDRSYLGAIERGEQNAGLLHLVRIAAALDMTLAQLAAEAQL